MAQPARLAEAMAILCAGGGAFARRIVGNLVITNDVLCLYLKDKKKEK